MNNLHAIRAPIDPERLEAAKVVLGMYRQDYGQNVRMTFESKPRPGTEMLLYYWCDSWNVDRYFHKGLPNQWGGDEISYFLWPRMARDYGAEGIATSEVEDMFIELAIEEPWNGPMDEEEEEEEDEELADEDDPRHDFLPMTDDEDFCDACERTYDDGDHW